MDLKHLDLRRQLFAIAMENGYHRSVRSHDDVSVGTTIGSVRNENQDVALHLAIKRSPSDAHGYTVSIICDGMGGLRSGKEAAAIATATFLAALLKEERITTDACSRAVKSADSAVFQRFQGKGGTTLSAVISSASNASFAVHAGDSRIYTIDKNWNVEQVSSDDNLRGALPIGHAIDAELGSRLIQYVGMGDEIEPHIYRVNENATRILITSDGAHAFDPGMFRKVIKHCTDSQDAVRKLLNISEYAGGFDNASVVVAPISSNLPFLDDTMQDTAAIRIIVPGDSFRIYSSYLMIKPEITKYGNLPSPTPAKTTDATDSEKRYSPVKMKTSHLGIKRKSPSRKKPTAQKPPELSLESPPKVSVEFPHDSSEEGNK